MSPVSSGMTTAWKPIKRTICFYCLRKQLFLLCENICFYRVRKQLLLLCENICFYCVRKHLCLLYEETSVSILWGNIFFWETAAWETSVMSHTSCFGRKHLFPNEKNLFEKHLLWVIRVIFRRNICLSHDSFNAHKRARLEDCSAYNRIYLRRWKTRHRSLIILRTWKLPETEPTCLRNQMHQQCQWVQFSIYYQLVHWFSLSN